MARRYNIVQRVLFRWKAELPPSREAPAFLSVELEDGAGENAPGNVPPAPALVERGRAGIEVELIGGRRIRFDTDIDPHRIRKLVSLLEADAT